MRRRPIGPAAGWLFAASGLVVMSAAPRDRTVVPPRPAPLTAPVGTNEQVSDSTSPRQVWMSAIFRASRRPAERRFEAGSAEQQPQAEQETHRPSLRLLGIIRGEAPLALVDGIEDGGPMRPLALGQVVGDIEVLSIAGDSLIVSDGETEWVYLMEVPWR